MKEYVKSPLNYTGGKFKLLPQIEPLLPDKISTFYDVFGGGGNVSLNTNAEHIYYNDIIHYIGNMFKEIQGVSPKDNLAKIKAVIDKYELSKTNEDGFKLLRDNYNQGENSWYNFYALITHSFNYQIRFNNNHEYNSSFGRNRSWFSPTLEKRFTRFVERINEIDITFDSKDFRDIDFSDANEHDLVYFDPPYLISRGVYQDGKRGFGGWSEVDELDLYNLCNELDRQGVKFAMSNVVESKGRTNVSLVEWAKSYKIHYVDSDYSNSSYQRKDNNKKDIEVLITNY